MLELIPEWWEKITQIPFFQPVATAIYLIFIFLSMKLVIHVANKKYRNKAQKIDKSTLQPFKKLGIGEYKIISLKFQRNIRKLFYFTLRYVIILLSSLVLLSGLFFIYPESKIFISYILQFIHDPLKNLLFSIVNYIPSLITIFFIVIIIRYLLKALSFLTEEVAAERLKINGFYPEWAKSTGATVKILLYIMGIVIIAPYLPGSGSDAFKGISVMAGIVISMGSSSSVGNAISGLILTYMRAFKVGDRVRVGEMEGFVVEKSLLVTRIKTSKNERITIPNGSILSNPIINHTYSAENYHLIVYTSVTIGYDVDWRTVHELLLDSVTHVKGALSAPKPFVLQISLNDFYVEYQLNVHTDNANKMPVIRSDIHKNIQDNFRTAGIEILSPHYRMNRRESVGERIEEKV